MIDRRWAGTVAGVAAVVLLWQIAPPDARGEAGGAAAPRTDTSNCNRAQFPLVLDVGHTAERAGASSARGVSEYDYNLRLATEIEQGLIGAGFAKIVRLVTAEPPTAGLFKRTAFANALPAKLLLSIHHDSVPDAFLETWEFEGEDFPFSDRFHGHSIFISNDNVDRRGSLLFARLLGLQLKDRGMQYTPHYTEAFMGRRQRQLIDAQAGVYRYDQLVVLRNSRMPAVLLEAGSIINRDEELLLKTPEHRARIGAAVTDAVVEFCSLRSPRKKDQVAGRPRTAPAPKAAVRPASVVSPGIFGNRR